MVWVLLLLNNSVAYLGTYKTVETTMQGCAGSNGIQIGLLVLDNSFREMNTDREIRMKSAVKMTGTVRQEGTSKRDRICF